MRRFWLAAALASMLLPAGQFRAAAGEPVAVAVLEIDYLDTSGEVRDQAAEHEGRLRRLAAGLRDGLTASREYRPLELDCGQRSCSVQTSDPAALISLAQAAGARMLLFGTVQKMSTLVQFAKFQAVNVTSGDIVFDKWLTFRGDTDESWRRLQEFVWTEFLKAPLPRS